MLLTFKGKGCVNCPFNGLTIGAFGMGRIPTCMLVYNIRLKKWSCNLASTDTLDDTLKKLEFNYSEKPKDCPFAQYPNTLEICADEDE